MFFFFFSFAEFVNTPTSVNTTLNSTATFNCSTNAPTGTFAWFINGSLLGQLNTPDITAQSVGRTSFLRVPAKEEYDNSSVVCELTVRDPVRSTEFSDPAFLRVQGIHISSSKFGFAAVTWLCHKHSLNLLSEGLNETMKDQNKAPETSCLFQEK